MAVMAKSGPLVTTGTTLEMKTGSWRSEFPVYARKSAPCQAGCPLANDTPLWVNLLREGLAERSWELLVRQNPFPAVTGRVCFAPCQERCNRGQLDQNVMIRSLERYLGDYALEHRHRLSLPVIGQLGRAQSVAVIGGGPAGLGCAYFLRLMGYRVTVFEAKPALGGLLRYGIPAYRLPKAVLEQEIERILSLGIEVKVNHRIEKDGFQAIREQFAAVFVAVGAGVPLPLDFEVEGVAGVWDGLSVLDRVNAGEMMYLGKKLLVVGGGNTAVDVARTALRLGSRVSVLVRRGPGQMRAAAEEVAQALEEGVEILYNIIPIKLLREGNRIAGVACQTTRLEQEERLPTPYGEPFILEADALAVAIGQRPDLSFVLPEDDSEGLCDQWGKSHLPGVFFGGDAAGSKRTVAEALAWGKRASLTIDSYLRGEVQDQASLAERLMAVNRPPVLAEGVRNGESNMLPQEMLAQVVAFEDLNTFYFSPLEAQSPTVAPAERRQDFSEVVQGYTLEQAGLEAQRCFSCGHCTSCGNCWLVCPDVAVTSGVSSDGHISLNIALQYCKGCGLCAAECPRGTLVMVPALEGGENH